MNSVEVEMPPILNRVTVSKTDGEPTAEAFFCSGAWFCPDCTETISTCDCGNFKGIRQVNFWSPM